MNKFFIYLLTLSTIISFLGCSKNQTKNQQIDNKSYINYFELVQNNPINEYSIRISSPKAIIDPVMNDIEILDSSIEIINKNGKKVLVKSGNSVLNNSTNLIRVFNNVDISLLDTNNYFIRTDSFNWDLNTSKINLNSPLDVNLDNTIIKSSNGSYNIKSSILNINNNIFTRTIFNDLTKDKYQIEIKSDIVTWHKNNNLIEFTSNNKQVETTINFLSSK